MNPYWFVIATSLIIILSYFFNLLSKKTNVPTVLMLIIVGMIITPIIKSLGLPVINLIPILEVLGIIGLIMIVLDATLDLKLEKRKWPIIWKSFFVALGCLIVTTIFCAIVMKFLLGIEFYAAVVCAIPLSIISSVIVIPSVNKLQDNKREFMIYESTFSDVLGIMFFYFLIDANKASGIKNVTMNITGDVLLTIGISILVSYLLIFLFQHVKTQVKLFFMIAILFLLYGIGKLFHLSSLLMILIFGLIINNEQLFFRGPMKFLLNKEAFNVVLKDLKLITVESTFIARTFFFVIFGMSIVWSSINNFKVILIAIIILAAIYIIRYFNLRIVLKSDIKPELYIAPRGLITVLLYFSIPEQFLVKGSESGILLLIILVTSIIMMIGLIKSDKKPTEEEQLSTTKGSDITTD